MRVYTLQIATKLGIFFQLNKKLLFFLNKKCKILDFMHSSTLKDAQYPVVEEYTKWRDHLACSSHFHTQKDH